MEKKGTFLKGAALGAAAGALAGILFAPKSGKETREDIKNKAKEMKAQAVDVYNKAKLSLETKIAEVKKLGTKLDKTKYEELVAEVVTELKNNKEITADSAKKLGSQLKKDWGKVSSALKA